MKWIHKAIFVLIMLTIIVVQVYRVKGDRRIATISPERYTFLVTNDQASGGLSTSTLELVDGEYVLDCELIESEYPWPYCGLSIHISDDPAVGLDLSKFHTFRINIDYTQQGRTDARLRTYLRNFNPAYSTIDNEYTHKYNGMEFAPGVGNGVLEIPIDNLQVMTWWLADNKIDVEHSAPEFSNVNKIEFATGSASTLGNHHIVIKSIEFEGSYIEGENLFLLLLAIWLMIAVIFVITELHKSRRQIALSDKRHAHLKHVNQALRAQNFEFAELAHRDALTGAMNRHAIRDWLKVQSKHVRLGKEKLTMLYIDIDFFKAVNDKYGHQVGDDILREFCMVVSSVIDGKDRLVRWGGEEFIVFCPGSDIEQARKLGERIRSQVSQHFWVHGDAMTCSIGIAELGKERVTETIVRADEALYQAKHLGRNRVEVSVDAEISEPEN